MSTSNKIWETNHATSAKENYLYKFLSKQHLDLFLKNGGIWFSRADTFGDKMECVTVNDLLDKPDYEKIRERQKKHLISCWHLADKESLVLWDTYSDRIETRRTFAIRFKRETFIRVLNEYAIKNSYGGNLNYKTKFIHGKIQYRNLIGQDTGELIDAAVKRIAFRKEAAFKYENEYRLVIQLPRSHPEPGHYYWLNDALQLPFDIIINPLLHKEDFLELKDHVEIAGFAQKLKESDLAKWLHPELW